MILNKRVNNTTSERPSDSCSKQRAPREAGLECTLSQRSESLPGGSSPSTDALTTGEIRSRSISGAKWLVVMNGLGMPATFLVTVMLGRIGPEALGAYALVQILINVITTFVVYGGSPVLTVFLPKLPSPKERGQFLSSYLIILLIFMTTILGLFWLFPGALSFLLQQQFNRSRYGWFVLLALAIVITEIFTSAASGLMLIKVSAIARQMMRFVLLPLVLTFFLFGRDLLVTHPVPCILCGFLSGYLVAAVISFRAILLDKRFSLRRGWLLPDGFWTFSLSTMAGSVFTFLYGNFDRMAVLAIQDVRGLGMYQAALSINMLFEHIPVIFQSTFIPAFSNLLSAGYELALQKAFLLLCRWTVILITLVALGVMGFSTEILRMFGETYVHYSWLLTLFGFVAIVRSMGPSVFAIVTCKERNTFRFLQQFLMILAQLTLTALLLPGYGIFAIAGVKMLSVSIASVVGVLYVIYGLRMMSTLPLEYKASVSIGAVMASLRIFVIPSGWLPAIMLTLSSITVFLFFSQFRLDEVRKIWDVAMSRR